MRKSDQIFTDFEEQKVKLGELHCIRGVCDCDSEFAVAVFNNCSGMNGLIVKQIKILDVVFAKQC